MLPAAVRALPLDTLPPLGSQPLALPAPHCALTTQSKVSYTFPHSTLYCPASASCQFLGSHPLSLTHLLQHCIEGKCLTAPCKVLCSLCLYFLSYLFYKGTPTENPFV